MKDNSDLTGSYFWNPKADQTGEVLACTSTTYLVKTDTHCFHATLMIMAQERWRFYATLAEMRQDRATQQMRQRARRELDDAYQRALQRDEAYQRASQEEGLG